MRNWVTGLPRGPERKPRGARDEQDKRNPSPSACDRHRAKPMRVLTVRVPCRSASSFCRLSSSVLRSPPSPVGAVTPAARAVDRPTRAATEAHRSIPAPRRPTRARATRRSRTPARRTATQGRRPPTRARRWILARRRTGRLWTPLGRTRGLPGMDSGAGYVHAAVRSERRREPRRDLLGQHEGDSLHLRRRAKTGVDVHGRRRASRSTPRSLTTPRSPTPATPS